jgi:hypothetical protein
VIAADLEVVALIVVVDVVAVDVVVEETIELVTVVVLAVLGGVLVDGAVLDAEVVDRLEEHAATTRHTTRQGTTPRCGMGARFVKVRQRSLRAPHRSSSGGRSFSTSCSNRSRVS